MSTLSFSYHAVDSMLLIFSLLSGFAALVIEVSWSRQVGLLLGHTVDSASAVLAAIFLGMAVGYIVGAKLSAIYDSLRLYGYAEIFVGVWTFVVPYILLIASRWLLHVDVDSNANQFIRWVCAMFALLPGAIAMGTTLPFLAGSFREVSARKLTLVYAINTVGAFLGVFMASFWLLISAGVTGSSHVAGLLLLLVGAIALLRSYARKNVPSSYEGKQETVRYSSKAWPIELLILAGVSGFGVLALETYYLRLFSLVLHNSTYTFSAVIAVTLLSLSFGAWISGLIRTASARKVSFVVVSAVGAVTISVSPIVFVACTRFEYFTFGETFASYMAGVFGIMILVMGVPLTVLGMLLPLVWSTFLHSHAQLVSKTVGTITSVNSVGAASGTALTSLVLLPSLGLAETALVIALPFALYASIGLARKNSLHAIMLVGLITVTVWFLPRVLDDENSWQLKPDETLVQRWKSKYGLIDVIKSSEGVLKVRQNLHYRFGSTGHESWRAYRQARLPLLLHGAPKEVLFLGLGSGLTAGGAVDFPGMERATVVELIPEVVDAARLLSSSNFGVMDHQQFKMQIGDARHFLAAHGSAFDVIVSDLFVPWESETGYLYTVEHYERAKTRLKKNGLFCQWIPLYQLGSQEFEAITDSFAKVFPDVSLWWGSLDARRPIVALIGSTALLKPNEEWIQNALGLLYDKRPVDQSFRSLADIQALYVGQWEFRQGTLLNTDERPIVEFATPASQMSDRLLKNVLFRRYYVEVLSKLKDNHARLFPDFQVERRAQKERQKRQLPD